MPFQLTLTPGAERELDALPENFRGKIYQALKRIALSPYDGKKLHGVFRGFYSWRVWPYRIIYLVKKQALLVVVIAVRHRQGVYK